MNAKAACLGVFVEGVALGVVVGAGMGAGMGASMGAGMGVDMQAQMGMARAGTKLFFFNSWL